MLAGIVMEKSQQREKILSHPKPLSPNQRRAVLSDKQHIRIIAGAGAGKTETLTRRIVYHLIYEEIDPAAIVAFTFTDKTAEGMKSRIYDRLKDIGRDDLRARIGDLYVGTIHGYCFRLLTDYFNYGNHDSFDENQERAFDMKMGLTHIYATSISATDVFTTEYPAFSSDLIIDFSDMDTGSS